jgi:predicted dinucleotide-binding enzyme
MGGALLHAATRQGLEVVAGVRDRDRFYPCAPPGVVQADLTTAAREAELVVLAVPAGRSARTVARSLRDELDGKVILDLTNPGFGRSGEPRPHGLQVTRSSEAEKLARRLPGGHVVKALNTISARTLLHTSQTAQPVSIPIAGDHAASVDLVAAWVAALGFEPVPVGPLNRARWMEHMAHVLCRAAMRPDQAAGFDPGFNGARLGHPAPP